MDRTGADFQSVFDEVKDKLGANAVRILIPIGAEDQLIGQIDVVNQKAIYYSDDDKFGSTYTVKELEGDLIDLCKEAHDELVNAVADVDDAVGEKFLNEEPITLEELKQGIRRATINNLLVPVAGGSAFKNKGVQYLLDAVIDYLPSPLDIPAAIGMDPDDHEKHIEVVTSDNEKFVSLAFKLWADKFVGKLVFFRVYSGVIKQGRHGLQSPHPPLRARRPLDPNPGERAQGHRRLLLR